jgi:REP element-mobilizing transposase RayT
VSGRGNERKAVFRDDEDRNRFVNLLGGLEARYGVEVHGYVLMGNHYHLLLRLRGESGLSAAMHWLIVSYTVWFNRRHRRSGHLFQGRFKAILVGFDEWGAALSRYVHLNPVRVRKHGLDKRARAADQQGLGEAPTKEAIRARLKVLAAYRWSSYRDYAGSSPGPAWLHTDEMLSRFHGSRNAYRQYVEEAIRADLRESPWEELKAGFILGGEELLERVGRLLKGDAREQPGLNRLTKVAKLEAIAEAVSNEKGEAWDEFVDRRGDWGRDMALLLARSHTALTNRELAQWVGGIDDSAVAQAVKRLRNKMKKAPQLREIFRRLEGKMSKCDAGSQCESK